MQVPYAPKGTPVPTRLDSRLPNNIKVQVAMSLMDNSIVFALSYTCVPV